MARSDLEARRVAARMLAAFLLTFFFLLIALASLPEKARLWAAFFTGIFGGILLITIVSIYTGCCGCADVPSWPPWFLLVGGAPLAVALAAWILPNALRPIVFLVLIGADGYLLAVTVKRCYRLEAEFEAARQGELRGLTAHDPEPHVVAATEQVEHQAGKPGDAPPPYKIPRDEEAPLGL